MQETMRKAQKQYLQENVVSFEPGDTITVSMKIREAGKERIQAFQGVVIQKRGTGIGKTFTVRKVSGGVYVERIFPVHSPLISSIEVSRKGSVRRAKLFYLRQRTGKATRVKEKR